MNKVYTFLNENNMLSSSFSRDEAEHAFLEDMQKKETLSMFNTYITSVPSEWSDEKILAIDAGGTNLRFTELQNGIRLSEIKMPMFGAKQSIPAEKFFDSMAEIIEKYDCSKVGFCFSYPAELLPDNDARIVSLTKEVKIPGAENKIIGMELNKRLTKKRKFYVLNDTVACSLGVRADIGMILGTGFNISFFDKKLGTIVNSEAGSFGLFRQGRFDDELNKELNSSELRLEKQISGAYLGPLIRITAQAYFDKAIPAFELKDISDLYEGKGILNDYFSVAQAEEFKEIVNLLLDRAADKVAMCIKCFSQGSSRISIGIEGSTIYKLPGYYERVTGAIRALPGKEFIFIDARGTISEGTARACLR